jgi:tryptophanyl-tRNA synthetase
MSKSYNNTIPLFEPEKKLRKLINKIKTNSLEPGEPKDTEGCTLFSIYQAFANPEEVAHIRQRYAEGIGWGEMKQVLFEHINEHVAPARERYEALMASPAHIEQQLQEGAAKARAITVPFIKELRAAVGIAPIA